jgi:uncharacterized protein (TIGR02996 family)
MSQDQLNPILAACKDDPLNDISRLVLADWLEEHGESERAEFIRLQLQAPERDDIVKPGFVENRARKARLVKKNLNAWTGAEYWLGCTRFAYSKDPETDKNAVIGKLERGTIDLSGIALSLSELIARIPDEQLPWLEELSVNFSSDMLPAQFFTIPGMLEFKRVSFNLSHEAAVSFDWLDRNDIRGLSTESRVWDEIAGLHRLRPHTLGASFKNGLDGFESIMKSHVLGDVRKLNIHLSDGGEELKKLARARHLAQVQELDLYGNVFPRQGLRALFRSAIFRYLTRLQVCSWNGKEISELLPAIAASKHLRSLREIRVSFNVLDEGHARALAGSAVIDSVETLSFGASSRITPAAMKVLAESPRLARLRTLDVSCSGIGDTGARAIAESPYMSNLGSLRICRCGITDSSIQAIAQSPYLANLEELDVALNLLSSAGLAPLAGSSQLGKLRFLRLTQLNIDERTFHALMNSEVLRGLEELDLSEVPLTRSHIRSMVESPMLTRLQKLSFYYPSPMATQIINELFEAPWISGLVDLSLDGAGVNEIGVRKLTQRSPGKLACLFLANNPIGQEGAECLLEWTMLPKLVDIVLYQANVSEELQQRIASIVSGRAHT